MSRYKGHSEVSGARLGFGESPFGGKVLQAGGCLP